MKCTRIGGKRCNCSCFVIDQEIDAILLIIGIVYEVCRIVIKSIQLKYFVFCVDAPECTFLEVKTGMGTIVESNKLGILLQQFIVALTYISAYPSRAPGLSPCIFGGVRAARLSQFFMLVFFIFVFYFFVPTVALASGLFILDCPFGFLYRLLCKLLL